MKENSTIIISILAVAFLIGGAIMFTGKKSDNRNLPDDNINNVSIVDGKQIIELRAKDGYRPVHSIAKAGIPTILRLDTNGTFDCTSVVSIPSLKIRQNLPISGKTDIDLGIQKVATLQGNCGMGMYPFDIKFE